MMHGRPSTVASAVYRFAPMGAQYNNSSLKKMNILCPSTKEQKTAKICLLCVFPNFQKNRAQLHVNKVLLYDTK
ncbi:MAG: hypothetical protein LBG79_00675 [Spirochaetaceae bacterium]|jgi:hypothetical protein|nr:hypothetical protein [Spirochaetaceae bacterium]